MEQATREELTAMLAKALALLSVTTELTELLIATHPNPSALQRAWHARRLEAVDAEMDTPPFAEDVYRAAFLGNMDGVSRLIDAAAAAHRTGEGSS